MKEHREGGDQGEKEKDCLSRGSSASGRAEKEGKGSEAKGRE